METLERLLYRIVVLFCILAVSGLLLGALVYGFMWILLDRSPPKNYPDDWGAFVWISEDPKAFITYGRPIEKGHGFLGGQMELDGKMQTVDIGIIAPGDYGIFAELQTYTVSAKTGRFVYSEERPQTVFSSRTKYKTDHIICKVSKNSEYFAGQKIVFMRYDRDAVSPADFGFELESWDDFVLVVDSLPDDEPTPTPTPAPTPAPTPGYVRVSADARPARQKTAICRAPS